MGADRRRRGVCGRDAGILERNAPRIDYWVSEPDRGVYNAWNKALARARGAWVCFLGADDRLRTPMSSSAQPSLSLTPRADIASCTRASTWWTARDQSSRPSGNHGHPCGAHFAPTWQSRTRRPSITVLYSNSTATSTSNMDLRGLRDAPAGAARPRCALRSRPRGSRWVQAGCPADQRAARSWNASSTALAELMA